MAGRAHGDAEVTTAYTVSTYCTGGGQVCNNVVNTTVNTQGELKVEFIAAPTHCSDIIMHILIDGTERFTSGGLSPGQSTGVQNLGPVSPGNHVIGLQGEGVVGGCNVGALIGYGGTLNVTVQAPSSEPNSSILQIVGATGGGATIHQGQCVTLAFAVRFVGANSYVDETSSPNTSYSAIPSHGFAGNAFCASPADVGKDFTLYAVYRDPKTGVQTVSTVPVKVQQ